MISAQVPITQVFPSSQFCDASYKSIIVCVAIIMSMPLPSPPPDVSEASPLLDTEAPPRPRGGREIAALFKDSIPGRCQLRNG